MTMPSDDLNININQRIIALLKGPEIYARIYGSYFEKLYAHCQRQKNYRKFYKELDRSMLEIIDLFPVEESSRIVATWLCVNEIPFDPIKLKSVDQFHKRHQPYLMKQPKVEAYR
jgi:predicted DNA-binding protein YlxM (UPF0122 family)